MLEEDNDELAAPTGEPLVGKLEQRFRDHMRLLPVWAKLKVAAATAKSHPQYERGKMNG